MHVGHAKVKEKELKEKQEKKYTKEKESYSAILVRRSFMINVQCCH